ncbi:hypothetical protein C9439_00385 [archaeon SCG-AAA382B04]|nr:hypothetical protein C9439_00385 [archaeon SCG-AAA382B04]
MKFKEWKPLYQEIIDYLNINQKKDKKARDLLQQKITPINLKELKNKINNKILVYGNSPNLKEEIRANEPNITKISADSATKHLLENNIIPNIIVTDLDGDIDSIKEAKNKKATIIVHSHGDNIQEIKNNIQALNPVIGTTQTKPIKNIYNFGGFTDGDRSVFLAQHFGVKEVELIGFNYEKAKGTKLKKLKIAKKLINYLKNNKEITINHRHQ